jgi:predicted alpha-1,2-mannosidase
VGISFISSAKACGYIDQEAPAKTSLEDLVNAAKNRWNSEVLSKITTTETNEDNLKLLYSSLYGMHILPSNRTGENPNPSYDVSVPYYDDFYTFWDLFRCTTPLYQVLQPVMYEELIRSLVETQKVDGYLPDGRSSNSNGRSQGGSNADNILADAYVKGVRGLVNWEDAYSAMLKDAEVTPPNNNDPAAPDSSTKEGRGALPDWLKYGFITTKFTRSVSRSVEYSANDFALFQVANGIGKPRDEIVKYLKRSRNWRNHWDKTSTSFNTSGFLVPRNPDGTFVKQDPTKCGGCYWGDPYYEGKPWEYTVNPHHDIAALIRMGGGPTNFEQRLNTLLNPQNKLYDPGNEPSFASPYLYNFVNKQPSSVQASRRVAKGLYNTGASGLPGNSDAGAMQSWLLWNMIGLYPLTGQTTFLIGSPWFADLTIDLGSGKNLRVTSTGGSNDASGSYVQSLKVNGKAWNQNWLTWTDVFANGGTMDFELGPNIIAWDTGAFPPSPASGGNETSPTLGPKAQLGAEPVIENSKMKKIGAGVGASCGVLFILACLAAWYFFLRGKPTQKKNDPEVGDGAAPPGSDENKEPEIANETTIDTALTRITATSIDEEGDSIKSKSTDERSMKSKSPSLPLEIEEESAEGTNGLK